jgi:hypothetical protein
LTVIAAYCGSISKAEPYRNKDGKPMVTDLQIAFLWPVFLVCYFLVITGILQVKK